MDTTAEDPQTKANHFRVPAYGSEDWLMMLAIGTYTIKDMKVALDKVGQLPAKPATPQPPTTKGKGKGRKRKAKHTQSNGVV